ncbi:MAG TPA: phosphate ABC transporter permease PstA [Magnetospirillum sp.]|jgi:phosphate transport system permease protein|nr:phosphate ABC transporter permease PstA [Magnetospirillum sp.]
MAEQTSAPTVDMVTSRLKRRYAAERRFRAMGLAAIVVALGFLALLLSSILFRGATAFVQTRIQVEVTFDASTLGIQPGADRDTLAAADYPGLAKASIWARFPEVTNRGQQKQLSSLLSPSAGDSLREMVMADPSIIGTTRKVWLPAADVVDMTEKGFLPANPNAEGARITEGQIGWMDALKATGDLTKKFNTRFFIAGDSRDPTQAGVWGAVVGSFYSILVTLLLSFPLGVATAVYLEEFAPKNRWTDLIEVNINNLAAVPSIVFGLLGLAVFLNVFGLPRSAPAVGGLVLTLMTLPTIIIAGRAALKAVPPSIREAALGMGASKLQMVTDHVLPLALPGILTGTILGMARALGESAPLLMIGMVAFIVDIPSGPLDSATVLPVQVYLWANSPERAFVEKTSAAIIVLLLFLAAMNLAAILLRKKFERRW